MPDTDFIHQFIPARDPAQKTTILALHGTGGNETSLLQLAERILPSAAILSPRGKVLENGMPRFFRRLAEGIFDFDDVRKRADELADFVRSSATQYGFDAQKVLAIGYSNGANIAAALLLLHSEVLSSAILMRAMMPLERLENVPDLSHARILLSLGTRDPLIAMDQSEVLISRLQEGGAQLDVHYHDGGHELGRDDFDAIQRWISTMP